MTANEKLQQIVKSLTTKQLIEVTTGLFNNNDEVADIPFEIALDELETRMTEDEFVKFCNEI